MSMATNRIATLAVAVLLASALATSATAIPVGGITHQSNQNLPMKMSPTPLTKDECTQLGGKISTEATAVCKTGKGCITTSSCGKGCEQENFACITQ